MNGDETRHQGLASARLSMTIRTGPPMQDITDSREADFTIAKSLAIARQRRVHPRDEAVELHHVVLEELSRGRV